MLHHSHPVWEDPLISHLAFSMISERQGSKLLPVQVKRLSDHLGMNRLPDVCENEDPYHDINDRIHWLILNHEGKVSRMIRSNCTDLLWAPSNWGFYKDVFDY
jgi:hypothetical protein